MAESSLPFDRRSEIPLTDGMRLARLETVVERLKARIDTTDENCKLLAGSLTQENTRIADLNKIIEEEIEPYTRETRKQLKGLRNWVFYTLVFLTAAFVGLSGIARCQ